MKSCLHFVGFRFFITDPFNKQKSDRDNSDENKTSNFSTNNVKKISTKAPAYKSQQSL